MDTSSSDESDSDDDVPIRQKSGKSQIPALVHEDNDDDDDDNDDDDDDDDEERSELSDHEMGLGNDDDVIVIDSD